MYTEKGDCKMQVMGPRLAILEDVDDHKTESGIITSTAEPVRSNTGEIVGVGQDVHPDFKVGVKVLFKPNFGMTVEVDGEQLRIMEAEDVLMVLS
jgi:co-chaperonin GroES (HSP10)